MGDVTGDFTGELSGDFSFFNFLVSLLQKR